MRRLLAVLVLAGFALLGLAAPAHADCVTPELPTLGCLVPGPSGSPTPSPSPAPSPSPQRSLPVPVQVVADEPPAPLLAPVPTTAPVAALTPAPTTPPPSPPQVAATPTPVTAAPTPSADSAALSRPVLPLDGVVASSFALVAIALPGIALLLAFLAGLRPTPTASGGTVNSRPTRLWTGLGVLAVAAAIGGIGWYRLSGEPLLNRQIPFLASAGIAVVLLSVLGGALIVAEQLRGDQHRVRDLEDAVRALTEALAPMIEQPPRVTPAVEVISQPSGRARSRRAGAGST